MKTVLLQLLVLFGEISSGSSLKPECEVNTFANMSCQFGLPSVVSDDARSFLQNISKETLIRNDTILTCHHGSPNIKVQKVVGVFLREYRTEPDVEYFRDSSWAEIEFLDIHSCADFHLFLSDQFSSLRKLQYLGIHYNGQGLEMAKTAFKGLDSLKVLDLSDCQHLFLHNPVKYPFLVNALSGKDTLPELDMLNLENAGIFNNRPMKLETSFFRMLLHRNLKVVKLKGQALLLSFMFHEIWTTQPYIPFPLVSLQASNVQLVIADNLKAENRWRNIPFWTVFRNFQYLSLSDMDLSRFSTHDHKAYKFCSLCRQNSSGDTFIRTIVMFLVEMNLKNFKGSVTQGLEYLRFDASACTIMRLKTLRINQLGLRKLNLTLIMPDKKCLDEMDMSDNIISYFFIKGNLQTKKLVLRNNSLQDMNAYPEFSQALIPFTLLEHLDISWNGLRSLPRNIFRTNINLKNILMDNNKLTSIPFLMDHLKSLQSLQLRNNRIKYLDQYEMAAIGEAINGFHTFVDLAKNPFECSCQTARFVRWLSSTLNQSEEYTCSMEDKEVAITRSTFKSCQYLCYRDLVHICVIIGCFLFLIFLILVCLRKYKVWRKMEFDRNKQTFITNFVIGNLNICSNETQENHRIEYIVMPAYHEDDYEICKAFIYEPLKAGLAALLGTEENLILFGLDKEAPGVPKSTEMERCTKICCVYVCVVTKTFCGDYWCQIQLENADRIGKPIVFLFVEELEDNLPPFMKVLLRRVFVMEIDCSENIQTPSWETSCLEILNLAVRAQIKVQPQFPLSLLTRRGIDLVYSYILRLCRKPYQYNQYELIELRTQPNDDSQTF